MEKVASLWAGEATCTCVSNIVKCVSPGASHAPGQEGWDSDHTVASSPSGSGTSSGFLEKLRR